MSSKESFSKSDFRIASDKNKFSVSVVLTGNILTLLEVISAIVPAIWVPCPKLSYILSLFSSTLNAPATLPG